MAIAGVCVGWEHAPSEERQRQKRCLISLYSTQVLDIELPHKKQTLTDLPAKASPEKSFFSRQQSEAIAKGSQMQLLMVLTRHSIWLNSLATLPTAWGQIKALAKEKDIFYLQNFNVIKKFPSPFSFCFFNQQMIKASAPFLCALSRMWHNLPKSLCLTHPQLTWVLACRWWSVLASK